MRGELKNFTGIDSPYERPEKPEIHLKTAGREAADLAKEVEDYVLRLNSYDDFTI